MKVNFVLVILHGKSFCPILYCTSTHTVDETMVEIHLECQLVKFLALDRAWRRAGFSWVDSNSFSHSHVVQTHKVQQLSVCRWFIAIRLVMSSTFSLSLSKTWSLLRTFHHLNVFFTWFLARSLYPSLHCILLFTFTLVYSRSHRISGLIYCTIIPNWFLCLFTPQEIYLKAYPMILP